HGSEALWIFANGLLELALSVTRERMRPPRGDCNVCGVSERVVFAVILDFSVVDVVRAAITRFASRRRHHRALRSGVCQRVIRYARARSFVRGWRERIRGRRCCRASHAPSEKHWNAQHASAPPRVCVKSTKLAYEMREKVRSRQDGPTLPATRVFLKSVKTDP